MSQKYRHLYVLLNNVFNSKRLSMLRAIVCVGMIIMINVQITTLLQDEGTSMRNYIHSSSRSHNQTDIDDVGKNETYKFNGIQNSEWCVAPKYPPLPYEDCKFTDFIFRFHLPGGLTNALHFVLKGVIWAYEENTCFYIDESDANMAQRDPPLENIYPFLERYFEPLSLHRKHPKVIEAMEAKNYVDPNVYQIQYHEFGSFYGGLAPLDDPFRHRKRDIQSLYAYDKDNIWLKKWMLRRLFRIREHVRNTACTVLNDMGLNEEYIALSIRRGDKYLEHEIEKSLQPYLDRAENAIQKHFGGKVPTIFVASDDCSVMSEIREMKPTWKFVGACDDASEDGFVLKSVSQWTIQQTDRHFTKFITEMIAMASAKYFIGVSTTNVAFWVYFMRHMSADDDTWEFVDDNRYPL